MTTGRFAALTVRDTLAALVQENPLVELRTVLRQANAAIRARMVAVFGDLSLEAIIAHAPQLAPLADDPRTLRLCLPATVGTLVRLDRRTRRLEFVHLGDTELALARRGQLRQWLTEHPASDGAARRADPTYQALRTTPLPRECFNPGFAHLSTDHLMFDAAGRFFHNAVRPDGTLWPEAGIGVVDGLPEMDAYVVANVVEDRLELGEGEALLVCSDGFVWPRGPYDGVFQSQGWAMTQTVERALRWGLTGYLAAQRPEVMATAHRDPAPRTKVLDDATAIMLQWR